MPNFTAEKKYVYRLVQKVVLVYIANFSLHDNCERSELFVLLICLNYIKPLSSA